MEILPEFHDAILADKISIGRRPMCSVLLASLDAAEHRVVDTRVLNWSIVVTGRGNLAAVDSIVADRIGLIAKTLAAARFRPSYVLIYISW